MAIREHGGVTELVVTTGWRAEDAAAVASGQVDRLVLNHALGFEESSLIFLEGMPLRELVILDRRLSDLDPVYSLAPTLRSLSVTTDPAVKLDLGRLPGLQDLAVTWSQVSQTIGEASGLRIAYLRSYQPADLGPLAPMTELVELVMKDRPRLQSLAGLSFLPNLLRLKIYMASGLTDFGDLEGRTTIKVLALEACRKIQRLEFLSGCTGLRELNLSDCGDLASLGPLCALQDLEVLLMHGSTKIIDNDLSPLVALARLQQLRIQSRRSYRPTAEELQALLPRTNVGQ